MTTFDIAVLGGGIAGASVAWRLAGARRVVLVERERQPGYHSTGRSAAMYIASYGPDMVRALTRAGRAFYERPPDGFADAPLLRARGALYVAGAEQRTLLQRTREALLPACPTLRTLTSAEALALVPCLRPRAADAALWDPDAMDIDVHALHQGFLRGFRAQGGVQRNGLMLEGATREGGEWLMAFDDGSALRAAVVVNAAGAWADEIAAMFGAAPVGLVPRRRSAFTFKGPAGLDVSAWPAVVAIDERWYFKPDAGQLLGSPANADPVPPHDVRPEELDIATGIARIEEATTLVIRRPTATWAGLRSFVADGELVIGWDDGSPGFFWLAGQGGYGIQSAAGASLLAAALLLGTPLPEELCTHAVDPKALEPQRLR